MFYVFVKIVMLLIILCGVIMIYDARILTKRLFGFGDQNEGTAGLKLLGYVLAIIGGIGVYFVIK